MRSLGPYVTLAALTFVKEQHFSCSTHSLDFCRLSWLPARRLENTYCSPDHLLTRTAPSSPLLRHRSSLNTGGGEEENRDSVKIKLVDDGLSAVFIFKVAILETLYVLVHFCHFKTHLVLTQVTAKGTAILRSGCHASFMPDHETSCIKIRRINKFN